MVSQKKGFSLVVFVVDCLARSSSGRLLDKAMDFEFAHIIALSVCHSGGVAAE